MKNLDFYIHRLESNIHVFRLLLEAGEQPVYWKQNSNKWSLLEITCHLLDEEKEDFGKRVRHVLETPEKDFTSIDPVKWVTERNYALQNFAEVKEQFLEERTRSVQWLNTLHHAPWENVHLHPTLGPMSAGFILVNWVAHDYLHFRQITKLKYDYLQHVSNEQLSYAGGW